jgi:hypothetical protein
MLVSWKAMTKACFLFLGRGDAAEVSVDDGRTYLLWWNGERWVYVVWKGQLYLPRPRAEQDQIWRSCCTSDSLLAYSLKIPLAKNRPLHYNMCCFKRIVFLRSRCRTLFTTVNSSRYLQFYTGYANHNHAVTQWQWARSCLYNSFSLKTNDLIAVWQTFRVTLCVYFRIMKQICFAEQNSCTR